MMLLPSTSNNNTDHVTTPATLATLAPQQTQVCWPQVVVVVVLVVVVTVLVTCVLGQSKMGARLWSERRTSRAAAAATTTHHHPQPHHHAHHHHAHQHHAAILTPTTLTHSVLYVYEGMNSVGSAMAAARDRETRYQSIQQDTRLGLPYQVSLPDGEERHYSLPTMKNYHSLDQEHEITREYIKPPANKTLFDVELDGPHRSTSVSAFPTTIAGEWGGVVPGGAHHRHSAPLDTRPTQHPSISSSSSSSSSSSWTGSGYGEEGQSSPKRGQKTGRFCKGPLVNRFSSLTSPKCEKQPPMSHQEGSRRVSKQQGGSGTSSQSPSHNTNNPLLFNNPVPSSTFADLTTLPLPCGSSTPGHPGSPGGLQGAQAGLPHTYGQSSQSRCSPTADNDPPPFYYDVLQNPTLYTSVSRPSEQRTNSGKI